MNSIAGILMMGALLCLAAPASAVYRCEVEGRIAYGDIECADGVQIRTGSVPFEEAAQARKRAADEKRQLSRLETEQRKQARRQEAAQRRAAKADASHQKRCTTLAQHQRSAHEGARLTTPKTSAKARLKASRADEQYEQECGMLNRRKLGISG